MTDKLDSDEVLRILTKLLRAASAGADEGGNSAEVDHQACSQYLQVALKLLPKPETKKGGEDIAERVRRDLEREHGSGA